MSMNYRPKIASFQLPIDQKIIPLIRNSKFWKKLILLKCIFDQIKQFGTKI